MAMTRVCDFCGGSLMEGESHQFPIPSVLIDNDGTGFTAADSSMTDVCLACEEKRPAEIIARLVAKARG